VYDFFMSNTYKQWSGINQFASKIDLVKKNHLADIPGIIGHFGGSGIKRTSCTNQAAGFFIVFIQKNFNWYKIRLRR